MCDSVSHSSGIASWGVKINSSEDKDWRRNGLKFCLEVCMRVSTLRGSVGTVYNHAMAQFSVWLRNWKWSESEREIGSYLRAGEVVTFSVSSVEVNP